MNTSNTDPAIAHEREERGYRSFEIEYARAFPDLLVKPPQRVLGHYAKSLSSSSKWLPWVEPSLAEAWVQLRDPRICPILEYWVEDTTSRNVRGTWSRGGEHEHEETTRKRRAAWVQRSAWVYVIRQWVCAQPMTLWMKERTVPLSWQDATRMVLSVLDVGRALRTGIEALGGPQPRSWCHPRALGVYSDGRIILRDLTGLDQALATTEAIEDHKRPVYPFWRAPEHQRIYSANVCLGRDVDAQSYAAADVYALGLLAYWLVSSRSAMFHAVATGLNRELLDVYYGDWSQIVYPALVDRVDACPPALSDVVGRALEAKPEDRWPTLEALEEALRAVYDPEPYVYWTQSERDVLSYARGLVYAENDREFASWLMEVGETYGADHVLWDYAWGAVWPGMLERLKAGEPLRKVDVVLCIALRMKSGPALMEVAFAKDLGERATVSALHVLMSLEEESTLVERLQTHALGERLGTFLAAAPTRFGMVARAAGLEVDPSSCGCVLSWDVLSRSWSEKGPRLWTLVAGIPLFVGSETLLTDIAWDDRSIDLIRFDAVEEGVLRVSWVVDEVERSAILHDRAYRVLKIGRLCVIPRLERSGFACGTVSDVLPYAADVNDWPVLNAGEDSRSFDSLHQDVFDPNDEEEDSILIDWGDASDDPHQDPEPESVASLETEDEDREAVPREEPKRGLWGTVRSWFAKKP